MSSTRNQYFSTVCVNILALGMGAAVSWTSPYLPLLMSKDSPIGHPINSAQASWIGSLISVGGLIGTFFYGWLSEKVGRFWALILAGIPQIIWWTIIIFSPSLYWLYLGRFLAGFSSGGVLSLIPLYVAEIAQDKIRGALGSFFILSANLGALLIYAAGDVLDYYSTPKIMLLFSVGFIILFSFFPETPVYLLRNGKIDEAEKSLKFLRGLKKFEALSDDVYDEFQKMQKKTIDDSTKTEGSKLSALRSPAAKKGILFGVLLMSINQLSGIFVFINYTAEVFIDAGSTFDPNTSATLVGLLMVVGPLISLTFIEKYSRKFIYTTTTLGNIMGLMTMGIYSYCKTFTDVSSFKYVPVASLCLVTFIAMSGRFPLTYIIMAEIIPQSVRSFGVSICIVVNWTLSFILLKSFSQMVEVLKFHNCMFLFSGFTLFGLVLLIIYVPETKNRSFEEIENSLIKKKRNYESTQESEMKNLQNEKV